jgi:hypothetical protein
MGHLFLSFKSILLLPVGLLVIFIIGFSRVYSRSRFPHQIVGSWMFGFIGLVLSMHCCEKMSLDRYEYLTNEFYLFSDSTVFKYTNLSSIHFTHRCMICFFPTHIRTACQNINMVCAL